MTHQRTVLECRPFEEEDLGSLLRLALDAFHTFGDYRETIRYWVAQPSMETVVATLDGVVIGFVLFGYPEQSNNTANILALAVDRGFRRQGTGQSLLTHAIQRLCDTGNEDSNGLIELAVGTQNDAAQALFDSFGFRPSGHEVTYPSGESGLVMRRSRGRHKRD